MVKRKRMNGYGNWEFCDHCGARHGKLPSKYAMLVGEAPLICRKCRGLLATNGHGEQPCAAMALAYEMCVSGLLATGRGWIEERNAAAGDYDIRHACVSPSKHAAAILTTFDMPAKLVRTRYCSNGNTLECWTTREGVELLILIQNAARTFGCGVSTPDMARRFASDRSLFTEFRALWNMDAPEKVLEKLIAPLMKGPPTRPQS